MTQVQDGHLITAMAHVQIFIVMAIIPEAA